jgi:hypothetical protein
MGGQVASAAKVIVFSPAQAGPPIRTSAKATKNVLLSIFHLRFLFCSQGPSAYAKLVTVLRSYMQVKVGMNTGFSCDNKEIVVRSGLLCEELLVFIHFPINHAHHSLNWLTLSKNKHML